MTGLTLVTGGPGSGKTARLVEIAATRYRADSFASVLVLVPTARHADQFRRRVVQGAGVAFGLDVTTINLFAARHTQAASIISRDIAQELLARVLLERSNGAGPAGRFRPLAHTPGLQSLVASAVGDLVADEVQPAPFADAAERAGSADLRALAEVYTAFRAELAARQWRAPEERARVAAEAVDAAVLPPLVLVDGMQFLSAGEVRLIASLAATSDVWFALDPVGTERSGWTLDALTAAVPGAALEALGEREARPASAFTAADDEAQLREIARSIKAELGEDERLRPSDFAVVFRRVTPHVAAARRVFEECALPLDPAAGERLAERPFGKWALRLLRLGVHGWGLLDVLDVCAAGFFDAQGTGLGARERDRLRRVGRRQFLWSGLEALRRLHAAMREEADEARETEGATQAGEAWMALLDRLEPLLDPEALRTPGQHAALVDEALFGGTPLARPAVEGYPVLAVETASLRADLAALRAVDETLGASPVTFAAFLAVLEGRMQAYTTLIREAGGVLLAPMHTLHGLRFHRVHVAGLSEGEFPAPASGAALLGREARTALAEAGLVLPPEPRATEDALWRTATSRAEAATTLWRTRLTASGRPAAASFYFASASEAGGTDDIEAAPAPERAASARELAISLAERWPAEARRPAGMDAWPLVVRHAAPIEQRRRSFESAGRHEGAVPGAGAQWLVAPEVEWSASRLESYRTCAYQFYARYALGLRELDEEQTQGDAATRGIVVHEMLEDAFAPLAMEGRSLDPAGVEEVLARLRTRGRAIWDQAPVTRAFGRAALWRFQGEAMLEQLERLVRREAEIGAEVGVTRVLGGERRFVRALPGIEPPLLVQARVDRIDAAGDVIQIVDYKTGRPFGRADVDDGRLLQLQLYGALAQAELGARRVIARYAFLRPDKEWRLDTNDDRDHEAFAYALEVADDVRADIAAGKYEVNPRVPICPSYCSFRTVCRVSTFSRSKTWS